MKSGFRLIGVAVLLANSVVFAGKALAAEDYFAKVNGVPIKNALLDQALKNSGVKPGTENPELRKALQTELIAREALSQYSEKNGLDKKDNPSPEAMMLRQNYLIELAQIENNQKHPITEEMVRKDYDRQSDALKNSMQYELRDVIFKDKKLADVALAKVKKGEKLEKFANPASGYVGNAADGYVGWMLAEQLNPDIAKAVSGLSKGAVVSQPIEVAGIYHVIKLIDSKKFTPQPYDQVKASVLQGLLLKQRQEFTDKVMTESKIELAK